MAFGYPPRHRENYPLIDITPAQFLALAVQAAPMLRWNISWISSKGLIAYSDFGIFTANSEIRITISNDSATFISTSLGNEISDLGRNKKYVQAFIEKMEALRSMFPEGELDTKYEELSNSFGEGDDLLNREPATGLSQITDILYIFKPAKDYFITPVIFNLNIAVYILMAATGVGMIEPDVQSLINWGANYSALTLDGQWWRLLTCCFVHIGIFHLVFNMYALLTIGLLLEPYLGKARYVTAYLLCGIAASITSLWWSNYSVSAGASGAIFGMYGLFLAMLTTDLIEKHQRKTMLVSITIFVGYNLMNGMQGNIDNAAHIGGLISGLLIGYIFTPSLKNKSESREPAALLITMSALMLTTAFIIVKILPNDIATYETKMESFSNMETMALEVYDLPKGTPREQVLYGINQRGIYYWNENINLLDAIEKLDLPAELQKRNRLLREYCVLRVKSYELLSKSITDSTAEYDEEIADYNEQIAEKVSEMGIGAADN